MAKLTRQLLYAPPDKRVEQTRRAERFHDEIDPDREYPFDFVSYKITGYRTEQGDDRMMRGGPLTGDLRQMIDALTRTAPFPVDEDEPVEPVKQLADRLGVSTKTIARWRKAGLRWRWVVRPQEKRRFIAITAEALDRFQAQHREKVERASRFSQMDPSLKRSLADRARAIVAAQNLSMHQVARVLASQVGRSAQAVRVALEQHDRDHPEDRVFPGRTGPLTIKHKRVIARAIRVGVPVDRIAHRFGRSASSIYRAVRQLRAAEQRSIPIRFVYSPLFDRDDADEVLLGSPREDPAQQQPSRDPAALRAPTASSVADLPQALDPIYAQPALTAAAQRHLFARFNYLKFKAARLRDHHHRYEPRVRDLDEFEACLDQASRIKDHLVAGNLRAVLAVVRQHLITQRDRSAAMLVEMLEAGNEVLFEAIETFDSTGNRAFPVYLKWRLMQRYVEQIPPAKDHSRAHRQLEPAQALNRMIQRAARHGVRLPGVSRGAPDADAFNTDPG